MQPSLAANVEPMAEKVEPNNFMHAALLTPAADAAETRATANERPRAASVQTTKSGTSGFNLLAPAVEAAEARMATNAKPRTAPVQSNCPTIAVARGGYHVDVFTEIPNLDRISRS